MMASDPAGAAQRERLNRAGGIDRCAGHEHAAIHDEEVWNVVGTTPTIDHGRLWIIAHASGPEEVPAGFPRERIGQHSVCACRFEELQQREEERGHRYDETIHELEARAEKAHD